jgi:hypothetical protein
LDAVIADGPANADGFGEDTTPPHPAVQVVAKSVAPATAGRAERHIAERSFRLSRAGMTGVGALAVRKGTGTSID